MLLLQLVSPHLHIPQFFLVLWQVLSNCLSFPFLLFLQCSPLGRQKYTVRWGLLFSLFSLSFITRSRRLARIRGSFWISKSQIILDFSFSRTKSGLKISHFIVVIWMNSIFPLISNSSSLSSKPLTILPSKYP